MTTIREAADGRLPRLPGAQTKLGSGPTLATPGPVRGQLSVPLCGLTNPDINPKTTMLVAAPPAPVAAIPVKAGRVPFDYASLEPDTAEFLRKRAAGIRQGIRSTMEAICGIGVHLYGAKQMLGHGQFVQWVESECGFSLRTAENYIRASVFVADKFATVANLPPATVYRVSAKNAPPDVVSEVLTRAARGARVSDAEVLRMFRAAKERKRLASRETEHKGRRAKPAHEESSSPHGEATDEIAKANAQALMKQFGRSGAVVLLGMRENILETLSFLEQEIDGSNGPGEAGKA